MATQRRSGSSDAFAAATARRGRSGASAAPAAVPAPPDPGTPDRRKYTVRIDAPAADRFDRSVLGLSATVGRRIDKSEAMRELAELLADDPDVTAKVAERLRRR